MRLTFFRPGFRTQPNLYQSPSINCHWSEFLIPMTFNQSKNLIQKRWAPKKINAIYKGGWRPSFKILLAKPEVRLPPQKNGQKITWSNFSENENFSQEFCSGFGDSNFRAIFSMTSSGTREKSSRLVFREIASATLTSRWNWQKPISKFRANW